MTLQFDHRFRPGFVGDRETDPPARHREGLRKTAPDAYEFAELFRQGRRGKYFRRWIHEKEIAFIRQNINPTLGAGLHDPTHFLGWYDDTGRIVRRINYEKFRSIRDRVANLVRRQNKIRLARFDTFALGSAKCHEFRKRDPIRLRDQHLVS